MLNFTQYYNSARFLFRTTFYEVVILGQAKPDNNFVSQYASKMVAEAGVEPAISTRYERGMIIIRFTPLQIYIGYDLCHILI